MATEVSTAPIAAPQTRTRKPRPVPEGGRVNWGLTIIVAICSLTIIVPLYFAIAMALKSPAQTGTGAGFNFPWPMHWGNFRAAWDLTDTPLAFAMSTLVTVIAVVGVILSLADGSHPGKMQITAGVTEELGTEIHVIFTIDAPPVEHADLTKAAETSDDEDEAVSALVGGKSLWTARVSARSRIRPGQPAGLAVDTHHLHFFDPAGGLSIGHPQAAVAQVEQ